MNTNVSTIATINDLKIPSSQPVLFSGRRDSSMAKRLEHQGGDFSDTLEKAEKAVKEKSNKLSLIKETAKLSMKVGLNKKSLLMDTLWLGAYSIAVALTPLVFTVPFVPFFYIFSISARALMSAPSIYSHLKEQQP